MLNTSDVCIEAIRQSKGFPTRSYRTSLRSLMWHRIPKFRTVSSVQDFKWTQIAFSNGRKAQRKVSNKYQFPGKAKGNSLSSWVRWKAPLINNKIQNQWHLPSPRRWYLRGHFTLPWALTALTPFLIQTSQILLMKGRSCQCSWQRNRTTRTSTNLLSRRRSSCKWSVNNHHEFFQEQIWQMNNCKEVLK